VCVAVVAAEHCSSLGKQWKTYNVPTLYIYVYMYVICGVPTIYIYEYMNAIHSVHRIHIYICIHVCNI